MKTIAVVLIVLVAAPQAFAQETPQQTALIHKGTLKVWTGISLMGAGAFLMPVTGTKGVHSSGDSHAEVFTTSGIGLFFVGGGLIWSGARDRQKALNPHTTFRVSVGKANGLQIRRVW